MDAPDRVRAGGAAVRCEVESGFGRRAAARQGLTPQKPLQRAYQRDPEAIARWQRETYPAIARQAKQDKADIYFWDESGFRADAVHGKTWGATGQTPVVGRCLASLLFALRAQDGNRQRAQR